MERKKIKEILKNKEELLNKDVVVKGWVRTRRDSKAGFSFIELNDGSTINNIQIIAENKLEYYERDILKLTTGSSICVKGKLTKSEGTKQEVEIKAEKIEVYGFTDEKYPLQKKGHSFEYMREIAHLRPRSNTFGAITRIRNSLSYGIHKFFQERGFYYIHTPIITGSDCEGAGEMFKVTTLDLDKIPIKDGRVDYTGDFFKAPAYLTVSGQLEGEIYACSMGDIYTFGPTFRAENSTTPRHLAEFWMVEPEMAFCELDDNIKIAVEFIKYLIKFVLDNNKEDLEFLNKMIDNDLLKRLDGVLNTEFKIITYSEAIEILLKAKVEWEYPVEWGNNLQAEHEKYLTEKEFKKPLVVISYPRKIKPFYMYVNDDEKTVRAMDILVPGIGEIIGGSQREHRLEKLMERIKECGLDEEKYWWYIDLRRYGTVPHSGFGLGVERMLLFITGMINIRDVIPCPRTPGNLKF
ncbi:MAG TPA: asparagine--tRNA ligase [bacterium]|nr:asparagine--tRNA ligase [bacterium]HOL46712.1 asparagine--tRNA ligase [bacterium]HPQ18400.1 asparagine--tRNA ligase [bacterium]